MMADEETLRRRARCCASRSPPHPPSGHLLPVEGRGEGKMGGRRLLFPSPHEVGRRCPGGADEGLFSGKRDGRQGQLFGRCNAVMRRFHQLAYYKATYYLARQGILMMSKKRDLAFTINDVARLLRNYADQKAAQFGMSRAKWAVLA